MMLSSRRLDLLPDIGTLKRRCQALAMLDAIIMPEWQYRYYSFDNQWSPTESLASMRNGSGDEYSILFSPAGSVIKGLAHEYPFAEYIRETGRTWPGMLEEVPLALRPALEEPAFLMEWTTFFIWRESTDESWHIGGIAFPAQPDHWVGHDHDGSAYLLAILDGKPRTYQQWAQEYYADDDGPRDVSLSLIERIYHHETLNPMLVQRLNPGITLGDLAEDIEKIGYPATWMEEG